VTVGVTVGFPRTATHLVINAVFDEARIAAVTA
jgi:hypothetical protein